MCKGGGSSSNCSSSNNNNNCARASKSSTVDASASTPGEQNLIKTWHMLNFLVCALSNFAAVSTKARSSEAIRHHHKASLALSERRKKTNIFCAFLRTNIDVSQRNSFLALFNANRCACVSGFLYVR